MSSTYTLWAHFDYSNPDRGNGGMEVGKGEGSEKE